MTIPDTRNRVAASKVCGAAGVSGSAGTATRFDMTFAEFRRLPLRKRRRLVHTLPFDDVTALTSAGMWFEIVEPDRLKRMTLREVIDKGRTLWKR